jgi:hypothetical protein
MKDHVKRFSMPAGALVAAPVGARFHPALARCQCPDSHCLRAHCTIKRPRVGADRLIRQTILHSHDDFPPRKPDAGAGHTDPAFEEMPHRPSSQSHKLGRLTWPARRDWRPERCMRSNLHHRDKSASSRNGILGIRPPISGAGDGRWRDVSTRASGKGGAQKRAIMNSL